MKAVNDETEDVVQRVREIIGLENGLDRVVAVVAAHEATESMSHVGKVLIGLE